MTHDFQQGSEDSARPLEPDPEGAVGPGAGTSGSRLRWGLAGLSALVAVLAIVALVVELTSLRPRSEQVTADEHARSAVISAAERFTVQTNTYNATALKGYEHSIAAMLSPKFKADYLKTVQQFVASLRQAKVVSKADVLSSAVANLDPDSATVLVVSDARVKSILNPNLARHFRWEVSLVKINGTWLIDDFSPVA